MFIKCTSRQNLKIAIPSKQTSSSSTLVQQWSPTLLSIPQEQSAEGHQEVESARRRSANRACSEEIKKLPSEPDVTAVWQGAGGRSAAATMNRPLGALTCTLAPRRQAKPHASHFIFRCQFGDLIACRTSKARHRIMVFTCGNERPAVPTENQPGGRAAHTTRGSARAPLEWARQITLSFPFII